MHIIYTGWFSCGFWLMIPQSLTIDYKLWGLLGVQLCNRYLATSNSEVPITDSKSAQCGSLWFCLRVFTTVKPLYNGHIGPCKTGPYNEVASLLRQKCTEKATFGSYKGGLYTEVAFLLSDH